MRQFSSITTRHRDSIIESFPCAAWLSIQRRHARETPMAKTAESDGNRLLAALPADVYKRLVPHLEPIKLKLRQVLYETGDPITHVYFPNQALISLVLRMK